MRAFFSFRGERCLSAPAPIHCLAVGAHLVRGEADAEELEHFLDLTAGPSQWLMTSVWMFARPPLRSRPDLVSVPVICSELGSRRLRSFGPKDRLHGEHLVGAVELRGWRWVAARVYPRADGRGVFPWELPAERRVLHA